MSLHVSVDFGTSSTCTVVSADGGEPQVVVIDGQPLVPSAVFAAADGTLFVGHEAERQAAVDPSRFEPHPKRRIDEGELLLGTNVLKVGDVVRSVLRRAVGEARRYAGGAAVDLLVLTHPADWGAVRARELRQAAAGLARELVMVPEPVAAAVFHSAGHGLPDGGTLAVLDLGGGTMDASVVCKRGRSFQVLATRGDSNFGGADIDQTLLDHVGGIVARAGPQAWRQLVEGREMADRRRRRVLSQDVRGAKETLSRHTYTDVPMPPPFADAHVTRADLERLIAAPLAKAAELVQTTLRDAARSDQGTREQLAGVFLVGGSSRIPMVSRLIHERIGVVPTTLDQPETVVARGALRAVRSDPDHTGGLAAGRDGSSPNIPAPQPRQPSGPSRAPDSPPARDPGDSLSRASTIVMGGSDPTRPVWTGPRQRRSRLPWVVGVGAVVLVIAGLVLGAMLGWSGVEVAGTGTRRVAAYDYGFEYPRDWERIGGDPKLWRTVVGPAHRLGGTELIAVQQGKLGYDVERERDRAVEELRRQYDDSRGAGKRFSDFQDSAHFAGRPVVRYRERLPNAEVDWFVLHEGQSQVSIGCQSSSPGEQMVRDACTKVVGSLAVG